MTIRKRGLMAIVIQAGLISVICVFAYLSFSTVLSKLRTIEIIDDFNISLLEMRKAEKNYFLYNDRQALQEVVEKGRERYEAAQSARIYIVQSMGEPAYEDLLKNLKVYVDTAQGLLSARPAAPEAQNRLRAVGHQITQFSESLLVQERKDVNRIINSSILRLIGSLAIIFLSQLIFWQYFSRDIMSELAKMQALITAVSQGRFHEVAVQTTEAGDEISLAVKAIHDMAQKLEKREVELLQAKKLASLGVLISGVAHELGNPLNNIAMLGQTYLSLYDMLGDDDKKNYVSDVLNQAERIRKIIQNLLDFSRQKKPELEPANLGEIVAKSLELVSNQLKISNVKVHLDIPAPLPPVNVDWSQIEQVLVNLYINAIQAMPEGGDLFVDLSHDPADNTVILKVRDTGTGIKREILANIFDPFFTTKGTKGTGLGLSVTYGIIKEHHGEISVESPEGQGTTFFITLPGYPETKGN
jgi:two-component system NtrC family sensor kinase